MNNTPNPENRLQTNRARRCAEAAEEIYNDCIDSGNPLDRILSAFFRRNKNFGSRDRRNLSETLFSVFRWHGWLQPLLDSDYYRDFQKAILVATLLDDSIEKELQEVWASTTKTKGTNKLKSQKLEAKRIFASEVLGYDCETSQLIPDWFQGEIEELDGLDFNKLMKHLQARPPMWLRVQNAKPEEVIAALENEGLAVQQHAKMKNALCIYQPKVNLYTLDVFKQGKIEVQDLASQCLGMICDARKGERWWDVCAGAGGKTLLLASTMQGRGTIIATDKREWKLKDLMRRAARGQFSNISPRDLKKAGKRSQYDGVLVDAPCSCTGTWRRNPDARWTTSKSSIDEIVELQKEILFKSANAVKVGGRLIYATCSFSKRENEEVVAAFLEKFPDFENDEFIHPMTGEKTLGSMRLWPYPGDSDAMFAHRFRRKESPVQETKEIKKDQD